MFGQLARPEGANNALAQVLYGLALRHGWGVTVEPEKAIHYLSLAASNSASIEEEALTSSKKGGAAKGELVLAIYELANCFRHGWGVKKDASAARTYYETAANLGDTDAMEEAAKCHLDGFGGPKDKVSDDEANPAHRQIIHHPSFLREKTARQALKTCPTCEAGRLSLLSPKQGRAPSTCSTHARCCCAASRSSSGNLRSFALDVGHLCASDAHGIRQTVTEHKMKSPKLTRMDSSKPRNTCA
jgi:TPR repeat protein